MGIIVPFSILSGRNPWETIALKTKVKYFCNSTDHWIICSLYVLLKSSTISFSSLSQSILAATILPLPLILLTSFHKSLWFDCRIAVAILSILISSCSLMTSLTALWYLARVILRSSASSPPWGLPHDFQWLCQISASLRRGSTCSDQPGMGLEVFPLVLFAEPLDLGIHSEALMQQSKTYW